MELTINVRIDLTDRAHGLLGRLLGAIAATPDTGTKTDGENSDTEGNRYPIGANSSAEDNHYPIGKTETAEGDSSTNGETETAEGEVAPIGEISPITDEEMRQMMDMTISRFAGNDWGNSKDTRTLAIKRGCTNAFKGIAKWLGAEKPTLVSEEKRGQFLEQLERIFIEEPVKEGGAPTITWEPF